MKQNLKIDQINLDSSEKIELLLKKDSLKPLDAFFTSEESIICWALVNSHVKINSLIEEMLNLKFLEQVTIFKTEQDRLKEIGLKFLNHCIAYCRNYNIEEINNDTDEALLFMKKFFKIVVKAKDDKINSIVKDPICLQDLHLIFIQFKDAIVNKK
jgi:hypothetical protein